MIFNSKKYILFVTSKQISVTRCHDASKKIDTLLESEWNPQTFEQILLSIRKKFGVNFQILLSEELVYVTALEISHEEPLTLESIQKKAQEMIPELLDETIWGYKEVLTLQKKGEGVFRLIQIAALTKTISSLIKVVLPKLGFRVESLLPASYKLALSFLKTEGSIFVTSHSSGTLICMNEKGFVIASQFHYEGVNPDQIILFISFIEKKFMLSANTIYLSTTIGPEIEEGLKQANKNVQRIENFYLLDDIKKIKGEKYNGLDLAQFLINDIIKDLRKNSDKEINNSSTNSNASSMLGDLHSKNLLKTLIIILIITIAIFIGVFLYNFF